MRDVLLELLREPEALPVPWFSAPAAFLRLIEQVLFDAYIVILPQVGGDDAPLR